MKRAIVTGGTKSDVAAMGVLAINIRDTNADLFDKLIIYHDGISKKDQEVIGSIFPTVFYRYKLPYKSRNDEIVNHFSPMVFCKFECFKLLQEFDEVVWTDYDVVILKSLSDGLDFEKSCFNYMRGSISLRNMFFKDIINKEIFTFDLDQLAFHASFFAMSSQMPGYMEIYKECYKKAEEWDLDIYLPEQCVFAALLQKYNVDTSYLDEKKYSCIPEEKNDEAVILHAMGQPKFWNGRSNTDWNKRYKEWCLIGGRKYNNRKHLLQRKMKFIWTRICGMRGREINS